MSFEPPSLLADLCSAELPTWTPDAIATASPDRSISARIITATSSPRVTDCGPYAGSQNLRVYGDPRERCFHFRPREQRWFRSVQVLPLTLFGAQRSMG